MATSVIESERVRRRNDVDPDPDGSFVLYWMQASVRAEQNPALEYAAQRANEHGVPLVIAATVILDYPEASPRQFSFFLGGLGLALRACEERGATAVIVTTPDDPATSIASLCSGPSRPVEVVCDRAYLRHPRAWRTELARTVGCRLTEVEGDVVVPVAVASDKQETGARTLRPKINRQRDRFLVELAPTPLDLTDTVDVTPPDRIELDAFDDVPSLLDRLGLADDSTGVPQPVDWIEPGTAAARRRLDAFLDGFADYDEARNRYRDESGVSFLSPYLHFGHLSPVEIAREVVDRAGDAAEAFLEELIVRRELAFNYVEHQPAYDHWDGLPEWSRISLDLHRDDERDVTYTAAELEHGETDDDVWNAIMREIRERGWVHNQLRMYWGKQIVRWTATPEDAHRTLLELNNRWFLDGRDPNSYTNVGWCFGLHDQGFKEREVSGKLRPFTTAALKRKDDLRAWLGDRAGR
ncbi:MAG: deoxyribodipyrimidine photo-lyase [Actinomycetota bacterium]